VHAKCLEPLGVFRQIVVPFCARRGEDDVETARIGHQVPRLRARQRRRGTIEGQSFGHGFRIDLGVQLFQSRGQPREIRGIAGRDDVGVGGKPGEAVESRGKRPDEHEPHFVGVENPYQTLRVERRYVRHDAPPR